MNATLARLSRLTRDPLAVGDGPLLDAFLAGDQAAFAALVRRHAGPVFATCRRVLQHQQDAEDAFQATFLVLARRAADVWPREAVGSWLFGVAHRVALKARTVRARRTGPERPLEDLPTAERPAPDFDLIDAVHRAVLKLPAVYRAAVVACDLEGLSRKDAADRLGWSEGTLSGRLARARELLARRLRQVGVALPAGGLATLTATPEGLSATTLQSTIALVTGSAAAPGPVVALTEGVVRSMAFFKLKAMAAVVLTACAIGFGALAATGTGDGPPIRQTQGPAVPVAAGADQPPKRPVPPRAKPLTDLDRFQGSWRLVAVTADEKTTFKYPKDRWEIIQVSGNTIRMPFLDVEGGWKQREYTFTLEPAQQRPDSIEHRSTIDLIAPDRSVAKEIYEFTAPVSTCVACHTQTKVDVKQLGIERRTIRESVVGDGGRPPEAAEELTATVTCVPGLEATDLGLRLARSVDGKRPTKFGGKGVVVFELQRLERARLAQIQKRLVTDELKAAELALQKAALETELDSWRKLKDELVVREAQRQALVDLRQAETVLESARARVVVANADVALATEELKKARDRVAVAEKALADLKKPQPQPGAAADKVFTVHIRTLTATEKVIRVKTTGKETVLEGLVYAADDVPIKSDGVSVWLVRDKTVLPVDLSAITKGGDGKTNYALKAGDQLFVQVKPAK